MAAPAAAQVDDIMVRYQSMRMNEVKVAGNYFDAVFYRHIFGTAFGFGPATVGVEYKYSAKLGAVSRDGVTLTASYNHVLNDNFRVKSSARYGLTDTDFSSAIYTTDTNLSTNLVWYTPYGYGWVLGNAFFPSASVGTQVNKFGRTQIVSGVGVWWNQIGTYLTSYVTLNGLNSPAIPQSHPDYDKKWAYTKTAGLKLSLSYEVKGFKFRAAKNFPLKNAGNDVVFEVRYRNFFDNSVPF
jgi:hypothetical protein